jgi:transcriptional regulator with XRE-family HTH domain
MGRYGSVVRRARKASGLSQAQLAEIAGIDQPNISAVENGHRQPSLDTLQRLLAGCGHALVAVGPAGSVALPHPDEPDDDLEAPSEPDPALRPTTPLEANQALMAVLAVAEATVRSRSA